MIDYANTRGATLIELMISLSLGALVIAMLITFYSLAVEALHRQHTRHEMHLAVNNLEAVLRREIPYARFYPQCDNILPSRNDIVAGSRVRPWHLKRFNDPVRIFSTSNRVIYDYENVEIDDLDELYSYLGKRVANIVSGSDALLISHLDEMPLALHKGEIVNSEGDYSVVWHRQMLLYLTDCVRHLLLNVDARNGNIYLRNNDRKLINALFDDERYIQFYHFRSHFISLRREKGERVLVQDFLDGQSFLRTNGLLAFNISAYNWRAKNWVQEDGIDMRWQDYGGLLFNYLLMAGSSSQAEKINYKLEQPFRAMETNIISIKNPREESLNRHLLLELYNL